MATDEDSTRFNINIGAVLEDTTWLEDQVRLNVNIAAPLSETVVLNPAAGWGHVLGAGSSVIPPNPDASTRVYVNIT